MSRVARFAVELLLIGLWAGGLLVAVIVAAQQIVDDEKVQYFVIGYYVAIHNDLVRWIWRRLSIEEKEVGSVQKHRTHHG